MKPRGAIIACVWLIVGPLAASPSILPAPRKMVADAGVFNLGPDTRICTDAASRANGEFLAAQLRQSTGFKFEVGVLPSQDAAPGTILITTANADSGLGAEGYGLTVAPDSVVVRAPEAAGGFYGVQTLLQLLPPEVFAREPVKGVNWTAPCVRIEDRPRFRWRGMMLDVSRQFYDKTLVKTFLDELAFHKLNVFHWHLTDDDGWRIEIKRYPRLTGVGAWRQGINYGMDPKSSTAYGPDGRYGGYYTQDEIREIVAYAAERHITIVPEIDVPGHSGAAREAYPELQCDPPASGDFKSRVLCAGKEGSFEFLENVLAEVASLFPGQYIHIGGDEANKENWRECARCRARIEAEGLKDERELQGYFIRRMGKIISARGKTLIGWNEILQGGLAENAAVMAWTGGAEEAASMGHEVVMTPHAQTYLNYYQSTDRAREPRNKETKKDTDRYLPLDRAYAFEPIPGTLSPRFHDRILGLEGCLWTPYIPSMKLAEYMMFPRLCALAEVAWSPAEARDGEDFTRRLAVQFQRFDQLGINYRRPDGNPEYKTAAETGAIIGGWTPEQIGRPGAVLEWDITREVTGPGECRVGFHHTSGAHGLDISSVALLEDGTEIARDTHPGFSGTDEIDAVYTLSLRSLKAGAKAYTLQVAAAGRGGADSSGNITITAGEPRGR